MRALLALSGRGAAQAREAVREIAAAEVALIMGSWQIIASGHGGTAFAT
jgi:hypothetical protein